MANEVEIVVKAKNDTKAVFAQVRLDAAKLGDDVGVDITERITKKMTTIRTTTDTTSAGDGIGNTLGQRIQERITEKVKVAFDRIRLGRQQIDVDVHERGGRDSSGRERVKVDVDVDKQSVLSRMGSFGKDIGDKLSTGIGGSLSSFFSGDLISLLLKVLAGGALAAILGPAIGAALTSGILLALGGGVIAAGVIGALKDPQIQGAVGELKDRVGKIFEKFSEPFKGPVASFLEGFAGVLDQITPAIEALGGTFAPVVDRLGKGFIGFLQNAMPGILRAAEKSAPLFNVLADRLPGLGDAMGRFFDRIASGAPAAAQFLDDFLRGLGLIIRAVGFVVSALTKLYTGARTLALGIAGFFSTAFEVILHAAVLAFGWIPGIGPKLHSAYGKVAAFTDGVNASLRKIKDKTVKVTIRQVWTQVGQAIQGAAAILAGQAHGGIIGGSANGATPSGLTWVGENGPELIQAAAGSRVHSNPDSMRMAGRSGGDSSQPILVQLVLDGAQLALALIDPQRDIVRQQYQGNVQAAYGR